MVHFRVEGKLGVTYGRDGIREDNYEEIGIPKNNIELHHEYDCGIDTYYINDYRVTKEEFSRVLKQLNKLGEQI